MSASLDKVWFSLYPARGPSADPEATRQTGSIEVRILNLVAHASMLGWEAVSLSLEVPTCVSSLFSQLPDGVNISKEARSAISRAASVFVLYATSCANNFAMKGKRKTLNASDVLSAMEEMEFQRFVTPLKEALEAYRREQKGKKEASEQKKKDKDKKTDSEEQDKSRDEDNDEDEERLEEEEQNEEEEVDN